MITRNIVKQNSYYDSVTLMLISSKVANLEGIKNAAVMMGTDYNKSLMENSELLLPENKTATANDMIIGIIGENEEAIEKAMNVVEEQFENNNTASGEDDLRVKTIDTAVKTLPGSNFTIISVPGKYAKNEVNKALDKDLNVLLFSDNVTIDEENELKDKAIDKGLLMMGPDCGTAIINGIALGFANVINRGNIGMVAAAGTGLQEVTCLVNQFGGGVSQALGTGGRDLKEAIGGKMMLMGLQALVEDDETEVIVLISKPPSKNVANKILNKVKDIEKPVIICFLGGDPTSIKESGAIPAQTLEDAALAAVKVSRGENPESVTFTLSDSEVEEIIKNETAKLSSEQKYIRGLYSGGTLCYESILLMSEVIGDVKSNVVLKPELALEDVEKSVGHTFLDLGDDKFTDGRPHPMIDPSLRVERLKKEGSDPETAVILVDVVLGYGSNEDPAGALIPAIKEIKEKALAEGRHLSVVAYVCGSEKDPQNKKDQVEKLRELGVIVMPSNAQAARIAALITNRGK